MSRASEKRDVRAQAIATLRELCPPGTTVHTVLRHVSRSGMQRRIDCYVMQDNAPRYLTGYVAKACEYRRADNGLVVGGCGMDMGFAVVYGLSHVLYPDGFGCLGNTGTRCPSNDHSNGDRDYTPHGCSDEHGRPENREPFPGEAADGCRRHWHESGAYALRQEWL